MTPWQSPSRTAARAASAALLAAVLATGLDPVAAEARLDLFLNGSQLPTPVVSAERQGSDIFLPVEPIVTRLQAEASFDATAGRLSVTDAILGRVTEYEQATGLVRRDGTILFGLAPGLLRGTQLANLLAPLPLVTLLFDLEAQLPPGGERIELASRVGVPEARFTSGSRVHVRDLRYTGYANHYDGFTDGGIGVDATARVVDGFLEASAFAQGEEGELAYLRSATLTYRDPWRSIWSAGDLRGAGEMAWLLGAGRGGRWTHVSRSSERRTSAGIFEMLVGAENLGRRVNAPVFDGLTAIVEHAALPPTRDGLGPHLSLGAGWLGRTESLPGGMLAVADALQRGRDHRLGFRGGVFAGTDRGAGNGTGVELSGDWSPYAIWHLGGRLGHYDAAFRLPRPTLPEAGTRQWSLDTSLEPDPWLRLTASHVEQHSLLSGALRSRLTSGTVGVTTPSRFLRSIHLATSQFTDSASTDAKSLSLHLDGGGARSRWFASSRRQWDDLGNSWSHALGGSARTPAGDGTASASFIESRLDGLDFYWTLPLLFRQTLQVGLGDRWERIANLDGEHFYGQFRLNWRSRSGHGVEFSLEENQSTTAIRLAISGDFLFPDVGSAPEAGFGAFEPNRGVLHGRAYLDGNLNGAFDDGDTPLSGVLVRLDGGRWSQRTDDEGRYEFASVEAGVHRVDLAEETVRADLTILESSGVAVDLPAMTRALVEFRAAPNRAIEGLVYADRNGNGRQDGEEPGLADVRIYLAGGGDAVTFHDGRFRMGDVAPGLRSLSVDATSLGEEFLLPAAVTVAIESARDPLPIEIPVPVRERPVQRKRFSGD